MGPQLANLVRDAWQAGRRLRRQPLLSLIAIVSLALAIGANTAIFSAWEAVMRHRVPVADPDTIVSLYTLAPSIPGIGYIGFSHLDYLDYAANRDVFSGSYAVRQAPVAVRGAGGAGEAQQATVAVVSPTYFDVLGVEAGRGRVFHPADAPADGTGALVVLSQSYFARRFGSDPSLIGGGLQINGARFTVVGVAPSGFHGTGALESADLWAPMTMHNVLLAGSVARDFNARNAQFFSVVARLRPGVSVAAAQAAMRGTAARLAREYPKDDAPLTATAVPLAASSLDPNQRGTFSLAFTLMLFVTGLVLLIACANVAHLLLARAWARRPEMAIRRALGASSGRLAWQAAAEAAWLAVAAAGTGLALAWLAQHELLLHRPAPLRDTPLSLSLHGPVLMFTLAATIAACLLFGLAPALASARSIDWRGPQRGFAARSAYARARRRRDASAHSAESRATTDRTRLGRWLLAGEAGFAVITLALAGMFLASLRHLQAAAPGFDAAQVATMRFDLASSGFDLTRADSATALVAFNRQLLERTRQLPGVAAATLASGVPMAARSEQRGFRVEGENVAEGQSLRITSAEAIAPGSFFKTMGIPLLAGRDFRPTDTASTPRVMIVNQTFARLAWPGRNPIGLRIFFHREEEPTEVVGVAADSKYESMGEGPTYFVYLPLAQEPVTALGLAVRTAGSPSVVLPEMRQALHAVNPQLAAFQAEPAADAMDDSLWTARAGAMLLTWMAELATLLAAIGVYGVAAYQVRQRWREWGIRLALGAQPGQVFRLVVRAGLLPVIAGAVVGAIGAIALARLASSLLFGVQASRPTEVLAAAGLFIAVGAVASGLAARRAAQADPVASLRSE